MKHSRSEQGFTLLEMLVAVVIISVIMGVIYGAFAGTSRTYTLLEANEDVYQTAQTFLSMISRELRAATFSPTGPQGFMGIGSDADLEENATDAIYFVTRSHRRSRTNAKEGFLAEIGYFFDTESLSDEKQFFKSIDATVDEDLQSGGTLYPLTDRVDSLKFSYYDKNEDTWVDEWDGKKMGRLPDRIQVELNILDDEDRVTRFRTTVKAMVK
ncbi:MAG: type II secretion system protein GspJ [bacterium]|nr:type II secretion system protein GspJ [bacterium]